MRNQRRSSVGGEGTADTSGAVPPSPLLRWLTLIELDLMGFSGQGQFEGWHQLKSEGQRRWLGCLSSCSSSSASSTCILSSRSGVLRIGLSLHLFPSPNKLTAPLSKGKGSHDTRLSDSILHKFILDWFLTLSAIAVAARGWRCWESRRRNITGTSRQDFRNGVILSDNALASRPGEQLLRRPPTCLSRPRTRCTSSHRWRCYVGCLWMVESLICISKLYLSLFA